MGSETHIHCLFINTNNLFPRNLSPELPQLRFVTFHSFQFVSQLKDYSAVCGDVGRRWSHDYSPWVQYGRMVFIYFRPRYQNIFPLPGKSTSQIQLMFYSSICAHVPSATNVLMHHLCTTRQKTLWQGWYSVIYFYSYSMLIWTSFHPVSWKFVSRLKLSRLQHFRHSTHSIGKWLHWCKPSSYPFSTVKKAQISLLEAQVFSISDIPFSKSLKSRIWAY